MDSPELVDALRELAGRYESAIGASQQTRRVSAVPVPGDSEREQEDCRGGGVGCAARGFDGEAEVVPGSRPGLITQRQ